MKKTASCPILKRTAQLTQLLPAEKATLVTDGEIGALTATATPEDAQKKLAVSRKHQRRRTQTGWG